MGVEAHKLPSRWMKVPCAIAAAVQAWGLTCNTCACFGSSAAAVEVMSPEGQACTLACVAVPHNADALHSMLWRPLHLVRCTWTSLLSSATSRIDSYSMLCWFHVQAPVLSTLALSQNRLTGVTGHTHKHTQSVHPVVSTMQGSRMAFVYD